MSIFNKRRFTIRRKKRDSKASESYDDDEEIYEGHEEESSESSSSPKTFSSEEIMPPPSLEGKMPTYFHVGGWAKECLIRGFKIGAWHFDCTTKTGENINVYSYGEARPTSKNVLGGVGVQGKFGIFNMCQAYQTDGFLSTLGVQTDACGGLLNTLLRATYAPHGQAGIKLELHTGYERSPIKFDLIIPILRRPKFMGYLMVQPVENFLLGYRTIYDIESKGFDKHAFCAGYNNGNTELGLKLENFKEVRGSIFQRIGESWAFALKSNLTGEDAKKFAIGGQYQLSDNTLIKAKMRYDCIFGMVLQLKLNENMELMYHASLDASAPASGEHKVGVSISLKS